MSHAALIRICESYQDSRVSDASMTSGKGNMKNQSDDHFLLYSRTFCYFTSDGTPDFDYCGIILFKPDVQILQLQFLF
jgi:hypothetical protein